MNEFSLFVEVGYSHILDIRAYDHIVFLLALMAVFSPRQWKSLLICLTAFTIGHSVTLGLAVFEIIEIGKDSIIELLIPVTVIITGIINTFEKSDARQFAYGKNEKPTTFTIRYLLALVFGLIHGLGFSGYLKETLLQEDSLLVPLLGFNLGIELGQFVFALFIMMLSFVFLTLLNKTKYHWNLFISGAAIGISLMLFIDQLLS